MRHLQLDPLATDIGPVLAPVELESLPRRKCQRHKGSSVCRMLRALPFAFPCTNEGGNALIGAVISQLHQIGMHQLRRPAFFA